MDRSKTARELGPFDCIKAPCVDTCPVDQAVPLYMDAVRRGDLAEAIRITREGQPAAVDPGPRLRPPVRDDLRPDPPRPAAGDPPRSSASSWTRRPRPTPGTCAPPSTGVRVAIIGAGPAGLAAARELARAGVGVTIFEAQPYAGGMVGGAIPEYRLPQARLDQDLAVLDRLGVEIRYGQTSRRRLHARGAPRRRIRRDLRGGRRAGRQAAGPAGRGRRRDRRRGHVPAQRVAKGRPIAVGAGSA